MSADLHPLSDEEPAQFGRTARVLTETPSGLDGYGGWVIGFRRLLAERDALAARVSSLEAERGIVQSMEANRAEAHERLDALEAAAQEVRRAWDAFSACESSANPLRDAIDALVAPLESPGAPEKCPRDDCPNCWSAETGGHPNYDPADCVVCHGSGLVPGAPKEDA